MSLSGSDDEMEMDFLRDRYHEKDGGNFEVFLSFRGEDTRASFTSHLYTALQNAGIFVFKDDESLPRGKQISPSLQLAIEESRISIVVFSKNYAESLWCMKELEKIMECHRTTGHVVLPVFYDVDPSEVRHQRGDFGKAFQRLLTKFLKEEDEKVLDWKKRWMKTLGEVGGFSTVEILCSRTQRVHKPEDHWKEALLEVVQISRFLDSNPWGRMKIADSIEFLIGRWMAGLFEGAEIPFRELEIDDGMDFLLKQWREVFCEPVSILKVALLDPCGETEIANAIKLHVEHCREVLFEAAGISGDLVLNSCGEMEITNAIELHMKHWRDAFSEEAGTVLDSNYYGSGLRTVHSEIWHLRHHWREKVREAYDRSGDDRLYSRREIDIERHLEHCTDALIEAINISTAAVFQSSFQKLKAYNRIESLVEYWRIALCKAAEISRLVVQHYRGITDDEINYIEKHARDALREAAGISGVVILNSSAGFIEGMKARL